ncbi:MAG TPA: glycosyltransferase [Verrucomicrobiae bacterium]|nr:glycosyltransferase [Verrucomicrobiae bacterium]
MKKWLYWPWAEYRVLRDARAVCFTCEEERRLAPQSFRRYQCVEQVLNYGTSAPLDDRDRPREIFFGKFPHLRDKRIILFLGRLHEKKGCDLLLKAFHKLLRGNSACFPDSMQAHLIIAGPDQTGSLAQLQALADSLGIMDRVTWPGMLAGELKTGALWAAEVFALPSHQENFGIAVVEAMACGVPVLISNKVNIWREIDQDRAGLVENDDEPGAFNLLRRWFSLSTDDQQAYRAQARRCFASRFEIHQSAHSLIALLEKEKN